VGQVCLWGYILKQFDTPLLRFSVVENTAAPQLRIEWVNEEKIAEGDFFLLFDIIVCEVVCLKIDTNKIVTATEANQNFSRVARMAEKKGRVVIFKNNRPKLLVIDLDKEPQIEMTEDEKLEFVAARILKEHRAAFEELAK